MGKCRERRKLQPEFMKAFIETYNIKSTYGIKAALADLVGDTVESMLKSELDTKTGYEKSDICSKETDNSRNETSSNTLRSEYGEIPIEVPFDRKG